MARRIVVFAAIGIAIAVVLAGTVVIVLGWSERTIHIDESNYSIGVEFYDEYSVLQPYDVYRMGSNGSINASLWYFWEEPNRYENKSLTVAREIVLDLLHSLKDEGFLSLKSEYDDDCARIAGPNSSVVLKVESGTSNKTVILKGNSMIGILPRSFMKMGSIIGAVRCGDSSMVNASLRVVAEVSGPSQISISGVLENNESYALAGPFTGGPNLWRVSVVGEDGVTAAEFPVEEDPSVDNWGARFEPHSEVQMIGYNWCLTGLQPGRYIVMGDVGGSNAFVSGFTIVTLPI